VDALLQLQTSLTGRYRVERELGAGGMAVVFLAHDLRHDRRVALKVLRPELTGAVAAERFLKEIRTTANLQHPNILPLHDSGTADGVVYYVMPFVEGESLRDRLAREHELPVADAIRIACDVASALDYAHRQGVVHRDIKPDNILLTGKAAVVTDFGVAKAVSASRERGVVQPGQTITGIGISLGTPQYMAPERVAADPTSDARADLYAVGIVAYEMLVGSPPFHGRTPQAVLAAQITELPPPLASRRYDVPVSLASLIMQCLEKAPEHRPRSAVDVLRALERHEILSGPVAATPQARTRRLRRRIIAGAGTLAGVVAFTALLWFTFARRAERSAASDANPAPSAAAPLATPVSARPVRVLPVESVGSEPESLAGILRRSIEAALVREGFVLAGDVGDGATANDGTAPVVVETTLQRAGSRVRALVRVTSPDPAVPPWADQIDFLAEDSFAAQDSIGARVVRAVRSADTSAVR